MAHDPHARTIMIVEDEALLSMDLGDALLARGYRFRFANSLDRAFEILNNEKMAAAILDVKVRRELVFPVARRAKAQGIFCVFTSGYAPSLIPPEFVGIPFFSKPYRVDRVIEALMPALTPLVAPS